MVSVCEIEIVDKLSRLVAADRAEDAGDQSLASALRDTERPLTLRDGKCVSRELLEASGNEMAKRVLRAIGSRKRNLAVWVHDTVTLSGRFWDGGSKSDYAPFNLNSMSRLMGFPSINPLNGPHGEQQPTSPGIAIIETGTFCGKDATPCLYIHPEDAGRFGLEYIPGFAE